MSSYSFQTLTRRVKLINFFILRLGGVFRFKSTFYAVNQLVQHYLPRRNCAFQNEDRFINRRVFHKCSSVVLLIIRCAR